MKHREREHLKTNEVAAALEHLQGGTGRRLVQGVVAVVVVAALVGAVVTWRNASRAKADALLADAGRAEAAQVVPPPAPGQPAAPAGSFQTEQAKRDAVLAKYQAVVASYPSTAAALTARFKVASLLAEQGRRDEALREFSAVAATAGASVYGRMAALAVADLQVAAGQYEPAIATLREFAQRVDTELPADGVLMQLGRAYRLAGKHAEALQTYTRITDEFPESIYLGDARREVDGLKAK